MDGSAKKLFENMKTKRNVFLDRAREASVLTIPQIFPPEGSSSSTDYPTPYQSLGARGVNNLANKIILSLFPPNTSFFVLDLPESDKEAMGKSDGDIKDAMYSVEKSLINDMEVSQLRHKLVDCMKQGIIGGSALLYVPDEGQPEVYSLEEFVVKRDRQGNLTKLIVRDCVSFLTLDKETQEQIKDECTEKELSGKDDVEVFTVIKLVSKDKYELHQEIKDMEIDGTKGNYSKNDLPYIYIPFVDRGEDYGRSFIEDYIGDIQSYEGLRQSLLEGAAESARVIYLLKPAATISAKELEQARSGAVLIGNPDDVGTLQADKRLDMAVTQKEADNLKRDLSITFLLDSAVRRDAERVTAAEIRQVSQELEVAFGGIYSTLGNNVQRPLVLRYMARGVKNGKLPKIIKDTSLIEITTGSAALGRGSDYQTLSTFMGLLQQSLGPEAIKYVNASELISRLASSLDIKTSSLVKTQEQLAQEQQAAQQMEIANRVGPEVVKAQAAQQARQQEE